MSTLMIPLPVCKINNRTAETIHFNSEKLKTLSVREFWDNHVQGYDPSVCILFDGIDKNEKEESGTGKSFIMVKMGKKELLKFLSEKIPDYHYL